jgi:hypothetical protein
MFENRVLRRIFGPKRDEVTGEQCCYIYRILILPVVFYGCETWSFILREEHRVRMFENRVLRRIFVPKRNEVTGEWRKLHNEELNDLYCSPNTGGL